MKKQILIILMLLFSITITAQTFKHNTKVKLETVDQLLALPGTTKVLLIDTNNEIKYTTIDDLLASGAVNIYSSDGSISSQRIVTLNDGGSIYFSNPAEDKFFYNEWVDSEFYIQGETDYFQMNIGTGGFSYSLGSGFNITGDTANSLGISMSTNGTSGSLDFDALTSQRTYSFPDATGTLALTSDIPSAVTASNGLTESSGDIKLGGTISETTFVNSDTQQIRIGAEISDGEGGFFWGRGLEVNSTSANFTNGNNTGLYLNGSNTVLEYSQRGIEIDLSTIRLDAGITGVGGPRHIDHVADQHRFRHNNGSPERWAIFDFQGSGLPASDIIYQFPQSAGRLALDNDITVRSASNGLTEDGVNIELGGALEQETIITNSGNNFYLGTTSTDPEAGTLLDFGLKVEGTSGAAELRSNSGAKVDLGTNSAFMTNNDGSFINLVPNTNSSPGVFVSGSELTLTAQDRLYRFRGASNGRIDLDLTNLNTANVRNVKVQDKDHTLAATEDIGTGWAVYGDSQYTSGAPLSISAGTTSTIDIDGLGTTIETHLPEGVTSFYDTVNSKITPENIGDGYTFTLGFKAESSSASGNGTFSIDIGGAVGEIFKRDFGFVKGQNVEHDFYFTSQGYTLGTFVANGGIIKITSNTGTMQVHDISLQVHRTHKAD